MRVLASRLAPALLVLVAAIAGCGAERPASPALTVPAGEPTKTLKYPRAGIEAAIPQRFRPSRRRRPGVFRVVVLESVVAAYAYRRDEQLPRSPAELARARRALVAEVKKRDGNFELRRSRTTKVDGAPAVELVGEQTLGQERLRTRSVHVYKGNAEYVFELVASTSRYENVNQTVFAPMLRSLELSGRVRPPRER